MNLSAPAELDAALDATDAPTHLLCVLGPLLLGFAAISVREVMSLPLVTPLAESAPWVAGAINLRGRVVPVLELRAVLGLEVMPPDANDALVIVEDGARIAAVRVDQVRDVQTLAVATNAVNATNANATDLGLRANLVAGIARAGAALVQLMDLAALLDAAAAPHDLGAPAAWRAAWFAPAQRAIMEERARALALPLDAARDADTATVLLAAARLDGELFGFDLRVVREFAPLPALTRVPLGPQTVLGLFNLRGEILPLLDVRGALGMNPRAAPRARNAEQSVSASAGAGADPNADPSARSRMEVIVVEHEGTRVGIWVEQVLDVFAAAPADLRAAPAASEGANGPLRGVLPYSGKMLAVLDLPRLLDELAGRTA